MSSNKKKKKSNNIQNKTSNKNKKVDNSKKVVEEKIEEQAEVVTPKTEETIKVEKKKQPKKTSSNKKIEKSETKKEVIKEEKKEKSSENNEVKEENKKTEKKQEKKSVKKEIKKKEEKQEGKNVSKDKALVKVEEKPDYVKDLLKKRKMKYIIIGIVILTIILITLLSTVFALLNKNSFDILDRTYIKDINISNHSLEEAKLAVSEVLDKELSAKIKLKYNDYEVEFAPSEIEFVYNSDEALDKAFEYGRRNNIVINNYTILFSKLFDKKIELKYEYNEELLDQFINSINGNVPGVVVEPSYYMEEGKLIVVSGKDGLHVDEDKLKSIIIETIVNRSYEEMKDDSYEDLVNIPMINKKADRISMKDIYEEIHTEPKNAYFETEPYKIYKDVDGIDLFISVDEAQKQIDSEKKDEYTFDLKITKAEITINQLGTEAFPYLISSFTTRYDASNVNRSTNLVIAANKINGTVLMPGEEFSFNKVVGKRTVEEGYKDAKIYADGGVVDGLAGGICQISSTLYNAVVMANLQIVERTNHSYPTSYLPAGKDATVVWGVKDFRFVNSRSYPIKIEAQVSSGIAEFKIHGISEENEYEIRLLPVTTGTIPYGTSTIVDPTLAPGQRVVVQGGTMGYRVSTYKETKLNGEVISNELFTNDIYTPMTAIVRVGP